MLLKEGLLLGGNLIKVYDAEKLLISIVTPHGYVAVFSFFYADVSMLWF